jgi:hypothetical protein
MYDVVSHNFNPIFAIIWFIIDILQLYFFYFLILAYYIFSDRELFGFRFGNQTVRKAYLGFMIIHMILTFPPMMIGLLVRINRGYFIDPHQR